MPFGIKGKTKKWEEETKVGKKVDTKIEDCVSKLMADPDFKPKNKGEDKKRQRLRFANQPLRGQRNSNRNWVNQPEGRKHFN